MHTIEDIIRLAVSVPLGDPTQDGCIWGLPLLIWGNPGIGKSTRIKKAAQSLKCQAGIILPAGRLPEDFAGLPVQDGKGGVNLVSILGAVRLLSEIGEGIMFIDEINTARAAVQASLLGFVHDRRSGDTLMPGGVRFISAANPVETAAGGHPLEVPLANRFIHYDMDKPSPEEWGNFLIGTRREEEDVLSLFEIEKKVKEKWHNAWLEVAPIFAGFIHRFPNALEEIPEAGSPNRSKAFPTPRTMEWAARAATTCHILHIKGTLEGAILRACIGAGAAEEFISYRQKENLPTPKEVLQNGFAPDKIRLDRSYAVYTALSTYITTLPKKEAQVAAAIKAWAIFDEGCRAGQADLLYESVRDLINADLGSVGGEQLARASEPVISRYGDRLTKNAKKAYDYKKIAEATK